MKRMMNDYEAGAASLLRGECSVQGYSAVDQFRVCLLDLVLPRLVGLVLLWLKLKPFS